jgi:hypothetical protein
LPVPTGRTYIGLFLIALATLRHEILLTRMFIVTMWDRFAGCATYVIAVVAFAWGARQPSMETRA